MAEPQHTRSERHHDIVDSELFAAERDASPNRFGGQPVIPAPHTTATRSQPEHTTATGEPIERPASQSSYSSASTGNDVGQRRGAGASKRRDSRAINRAPTASDRMNELERNETHMSRIHTARTQHGGTVGVPSLRSRTRTSRKVMPTMGHGKPMPPALPDREEYVVEFDGEDDPLHAQNWPTYKKVLTAAMLAYTTFIATAASSIFSAAIPAVVKVFGVGREVGTLGTSFYVLGFAFGPIFWAPLSELKGRRLPLVIAPFGMMVFNFAVATGKDLQTVLICRFFAGLFGSAPLAVVAAVFSDMFNNATRGIAITIFSLTVFTGPLMQPFIGGFITSSSLGWRWTEYLMGILSSSALILNVLFLKESYPPIILITKAAELRRRTKNWGIHAKQEEIEVDLRELLERNFSRPLRMLVTEPIVLLLSIYMAFIYGLLYLFLTAYPLVFQGKYHFSPGVAGLTFFGMIIGQVSAGVLIFIRQPGYRKKLEANGGRPIPEWRCPEIIAGGLAFAGGLFWFGWSGYRGDVVHWIVPTLSGLLTGFGLLAIFLQSLNYLVDAYLMFAASAIAANTFLRSLFGAIFPLFATQMFNGMGIEWASTLLGCVALVLVPVPVWFYLRGGRVRERSAFAPTGPPPAAANKGKDGSDTENGKEEV